MKEMILLFNPPAKEQLLKIRSALLPLHIRIQLIKPEQYNQPLGYLAGMKDISPVEGNYAGEELPDTMFLFSSLSTQRARRSQLIFSFDMTFGCFVQFTKSLDEKASIKVCSS